MARTREFDERQALIAAMLVFWEKGYEATTIQDLERAMGLNRTSIYNAFGNKREIFLRIIECYKESVMLVLIRDMDEAPDIREGIRRLLNGALDIHFDTDNPGGCLVVLSVLESGQHDNESTEILTKTVHTLRDELQKRLQRAKNAGELSKQINVAATATTIATTMAGMMVMGKAQFSRATLNRTIKQVLELLD